MDQKKVVPTVLKMRAERILGERIAACYQLNEGDNNVLECITAAGKTRFVNLETKKELKGDVLLKVQTDTHEVEPEKINEEVEVEITAIKDSPFVSSPVEKERKFKSKIARDDAEPKEEKPIKKTTAKKSKK